MNGYLQTIRESYASPLDEDRVWVNGYGRSVHIPIEDIREVVEANADGIETTFNAVVDVSNHEPPRVGIRDEREVILAVILGRTADRDMADRALETVDYQIRDEIHRLDREDGGDDE